MRIDPEDLRRHYASLPDGALRDINRAELTDIAKSIYDQEIAKRHPQETGEDQEAAESIDDFDEMVDEEVELANDAGPEPAWLEDATCACAFTMRGGVYDVPGASHARTALREAGIPCHLVVVEEPPARVDPAPQSSLRLMVPGGLALHATSVLDEYVFNESHEADWRANFEALSDQELRALDPEVLCAGLLDRVARLKSAYEDEMARRKLKRR
jgi:hypothetical protein